MKPLLLNLENEHDCGLLEIDLSAASSFRAEYVAHIFWNPEREHEWKAEGRARSLMNELRRGKTGAGVRKAGPAALTRDELGRIGEGVLALVFKQTSRAVCKTIDKRPDFILSGRSTDVKSAAVRIPGVASFSIEAGKITEYEQLLLFEYQAPGLAVLCTANQAALRNLPVLPGRNSTDFVLLRIPVPVLSAQLASSFATRSNELTRVVC